MFSFQTIKSSEISSIISDNVRNVVILFASALDALRQDARVAHRALYGSDLLLSSFRGRDTIMSNIALDEHGLTLPSETQQTITQHSHPPQIIRRSGILIYVPDNVIGNDARVITYAIGEAVKEQPLSEIIFIGTNKERYSVPFNYSKGATWRPRHYYTVEPSIELHQPTSADFKHFDRVQNFKRDISAKARVRIKANLNACELLDRDLYATSVQALSDETPYYLSLCPFCGGEQRLNEATVLRYNSIGQPYNPTRTWYGCKNFPSFTNDSSACSSYRGQTPSDWLDDKPFNAKKAQEREQERMQEVYSDALIDEYNRQQRRIMASEPKGRIKVKEFTPTRPVQYQPFTDRLADLLKADAKRTSKQGILANEYTRQTLRAISKQLSTPIAPTRCHNSCCVGHHLTTYTDSFQPHDFNWSVGAEPYKAEMPSILLTPQGTTQSPLYNRPRWTTTPTFNYNLVEMPTPTYRPTQGATLEGYQLDFETFYRLQNNGDVLPEIIVSNPSQKRITGKQRRLLATRLFNYFGTDMAAETRAGN